MAEADRGLSISLCVGAAVAGLFLALGAVPGAIAADDSSQASLLVKQTRLLSEKGSTRATRYAGTNKIVTQGGKTHVAWLDSISDTMVAGYDHALGKWTSAVKVGRGTDNHGGPALSCDSRGYLHIVFGPHGRQPFQHYRSARPNDSASWVRLDGFGHHPTYPSVACDDEDTLHIIYRGDKQGPPLKLIYQRKPRGGSWSEPRALARAPAQWKGYTAYHASIAVAAGNTLHVAYDIYYNGSAKHAGHMMSRDRGKTWKLADGSLLDLPVTPDSNAFFARTDQALKVLNIACDSKGLPWIGLADGVLKAGPVIYHHDGKKWDSLCPGKLTSPAIAFEKLGSGGTLSIDSQDQLYLSATLGTPVRGGTQGRVVILYSTDHGKQFRLLSVCPPDERLPHTGISMERPGGHHAVGVPWMLFSTGEKGPDCFGKGILHKVRVVELDFGPRK